MSRYRFRGIDGVWAAVLCGFLWIGWFGDYGFGCILGLGCAVNFRMVVLLIRIVPVGWVGVQVVLLLSVFGFVVLCV